MAYIMHIKTKEDKITNEYDVSEIVHDIEFTTSMIGQAGKLTFTLEKDPNDILSISVGSLVQFWDCDIQGKTPIFQGNVFKIGTDSTESYKVIAYDQLRYLQNPIMKTFGDDKTLTDIFELLCDEFELKYSKTYNWLTAGSKLTIEGNTFLETSVFDVLQYYINRANNEYVSTILQFNGKRFPFQRFYIKDNFGTLELREVAYDFMYDEKTNQPKTEFLIIGNESLLMNYQYETDIDSDTFNEIVFTYNEKNQKQTSKTNEQVQSKTIVATIQAGTPISGTKTHLDGTTIGKDTIPKWGKLRKMIEVNTIENKALLGNYYKDVLELSNEPKRSMKLSAIGYNGINAGSSFILKLDKLKINYPVYVLSATHYYNADKHTMDLNVCANSEMEVFE